MLTIVLCRFSVPVGKYFLKIIQHYLLRFLSREWLASSHAHTAEIPDSVCCYRSDSRKKLIKAMLQGSGYAMLFFAASLLRIASGLETKSAVNFFHKSLRLRIILLLGNKVSSRNSFKVKENQNLLLERQEALTQIAAVRGVV